MGAGDAFLETFVTIESAPRCISAPFSTASAVCSSGVYLASQERAVEIGMRSNRFPPVLQQFAVVLTHIDQSVKVGTTLTPRSAMEQAR